MKEKRVKTSTLFLSEELVSKTLSLNELFPQKSTQEQPAEALRSPGWGPSKNSYLERAQPGPRGPTRRDGWSNVTS